eukprot:11415047-Alexandrium_andersonii.AAC.1
MRYSSVPGLSEIALVGLPGRPLPLEHGGGHLSLMPRRYLHVGNARRQGAQLAMDLGKFGAQLGVEVVELRRRSGTTKR